MTTTPSVSIADLFAARLEELKQQDIRSRAKTKATLASIQSLVAELESLEFEVEYFYPSFTGGVIKRAGSAPPSEGGTPAPCSPSRTFEP
jgi:hypothetical protein